MTEQTVEPQPITREQATSLVGKHLLAVLEDVIASHELVLVSETQTATQKANAQLVIATAKAFGAPLYQVVKAAGRPRILRPERSIRIVR